MLKKCSMSTLLPIVAVCCMWGSPAICEDGFIQHREGWFEGFTKSYDCHRLVWFERFSTASAGIAREKQIKRWRREKQVALIERENPTWEDLSLQWSGPVELYQWDGN